jgi:2-keto-4-pentenoate hydratase/2-oxohepta-3-ene-1,7-dioic acid hydratase in catechol pathway
VPLSPRPSKIVCIGRNYVDHAKELGNDVPSELLFFLKPPSSLIGNGDQIVLPAQSARVEFEGEIGLIIGARLRNASESEAARAVRSVVALNDVTARDLQLKDSQWTRAKGFDTFCAVGEPAPAPADLGSLEIVTRLNGVERQRGRADQMHFPIAFALSYISRIMTLEPGDLIATGTPAGVAPLSSGDEIEVEISGLSRVVNRVQGQQQ